MQAGARTHRHSRPEPTPAACLRRGATIAAWPTTRIGSRIRAGAASTPEARCAGSSRRKTTANSATWRSGSRITSPARQSSAYSLCDGPNLDARRGHTTFGKGSLAPANPIVWLQSGESIAMSCRAGWQGAKYVDIDCDKAWRPSDIANPEPRVQRWRLFKGITHQSMAIASPTMPATIAAARVLSTWEITR